uniref:Leucine-rich repeat-containing protein 56 n=1 Tax=Oncorhynchus kisutch TaxID=8019 RepID=A0A8C7CVX1_ONCKI
MITSVGDLGTTLSHLQVLWISHCSLADLDGVPSSSLKELYVAYNRVSDLSQVSMLENLQLLDLEGNDVDDLVQVQYLGRHSQLRTLTLEGNTVCMHPHPNATQFEEEKGYCYRLAVRELVQPLHYLDYMCAEEKAGPCCTSSMGEDWALLRESIKDGSCVEMAQGVCVCLFASIRPLILLCIVLLYMFPLLCLAIKERAASVSAYSRPSSGQRLANSLSSSHPSSRPVSASVPGPSQQLTPDPFLGRDPYQGLDPEPSLLPGPDPVLLMQVQPLWTQTLAF